MTHIKRIDEMSIRNKEVDANVINQDGEREFIDFGGNTTVLWAKYALEIDGKNTFSFDEVKDFYDNGWRLPTVEEVKQIFKPNTRWNAPWYDGCRIIKIKGEELRIRGEEPWNGFNIWTKDEDTRWEAPHAYSYGISNSYEFDIHSYGTWQRFYVFLVKDKK